jgi:hypothetical protein
LELDFTQPATATDPRANETEEGRKAKSPSPPVTIISVRLYPTKTRDRRSNAEESARLLMTSLQAYLMAQQHHPSPA